MQVKLSTSAGVRYPEDGRRLIVFVVHDPHGDVDDYVLHALQSLRDSADSIVAVVNGELTRDSRTRLRTVADSVLQRPNRGFDIWAHKHAIDFLGDDIDDFDEVVFTNDTWYGPVRPFAPVFERMDPQELDFWAMTSHAAQKATEVDGAVDAHLQSFWIAVRRRMLQSDGWRDYWKNLPDFPRYHDAVNEHEIRFVHRFEEMGFVSGAAFPAEDFPVANPSILTPDLLAQAGCPLVKRRVFSHYQPYLHRHAVIGRWMLADLADHYPVQLILRHLARTLSSRALNAGLGLFEVLTGTRTRAETASETRVAVFLHVAEGRGYADLVERIRRLPGVFDFFVSTSDPAVAQQIEAIATSDTAADLPSATVLPAGAGLMGAVLLGWAAAVESADYDLVLAAEPATQEELRVNESALRARRGLEPLLDTPGAFGDVVALFDAEPGLGVVLPPTSHVGRVPTETDEFEWAVEQLRKELGVRVPLDRDGVLAPDDGVFVARPAALRLMTEVDWRARDYTDARRARGVELAPVQAAVLLSAAAQIGFHHRTALTTTQATISYPSLEFKTDQLLSTTAGYPLEQIQFLQRARLPERLNIVGFAQMYLRLQHPEVAAGATRARDRVAKPLVFLAWRIFRAAFPGAARRLRTVLRRTSTQKEV